MQTVIFYDIKEYERNYFEQNLIDKVNMVFNTHELFPETELSYQEENAQIISVFTASRLTKFKADFNPFRRF